MVSHEDRKRERLSLMIEAINRGVKRSDLINNCMIEWGMARRTLMEYIKVIEYKLGPIKD